MLERELKFINDFLINKIQKLGNYFSYEQLSSAGVHPAVLKFISAEIDYLIYIDRQRLIKDSVFDYSGNEITGRFSEISDEIKRTRKFSSDYISQLVLRSTTFNINYLYSPNLSLIKFIFGSDEKLSSTDILQKLKYFYYYEFLIAILQGYFERKKVLSMTEDEFAEIIDKIDNKVILKYGTKLLQIMVNSMADFFSMGETTKRTIPLIAIKMYLNEKNFSFYEGKIDAEIEKGLKSSLELGEILRILFKGELPPTPYGTDGPQLGYRKTAQIPEHTEEVEPDKQETEFVEANEEQKPDKTQESKTVKEFDLEYDKLAMNFEIVDDESTATKEEVLEESSSQDEFTSEPEKFSEEIIQPKTEEINEIPEVKYSEKAEAESFDFAEPEIFAKREKPLDDDNDIHIEYQTPYVRSDEPDEIQEAQNQSEIEDIYGIAGKSNTNKIFEPETTSHSGKFEIVDESEKADALPEEKNDQADTETKNDEIPSFDEERVSEEINQQEETFTEEENNLEVIELDEDPDEDIFIEAEEPEVQPIEEATIPEAVNEPTQESVQSEQITEENPTVLETTSNISKEEDDEMSALRNENTNSIDEISDPDIQTDIKKEAETSEDYENVFSEENNHSKNKFVFEIIDTPSESDNEETLDVKKPDDTITSNSIPEEEHNNKTDIEEQPTQQKKISIFRIKKPEKRRFFWQLDKKQDVKEEIKPETERVNEEVPEPAPQPETVEPEKMPETPEVPVVNEEKGILKGQSKGEKFTPDQSDEDIDMSALLEYNKITKVVEVIFNYDNSEFSLFMEMIKDAKDKESAYSLMNKYFQDNKINPNLREAVMFKEIITKYFERK